MVIVTCELAGAHGLKPVAVRVSVTEPLEISSALGVYIWLPVIASMLKPEVPEDEDSHNILIWLVVLAPERSTKLLEQMICGGPALAVGCRLIYKIIASCTAAQEVYGLAVRVRVTDPALISAGVGVYSGCREKSFGIKIPPVGEKQGKEVDPAAVEEDKIYLLVSQMVASAPAYA